jgi:hypothetical protein
MLVTEPDAVTKQWCPMVRLRWESRPFAFNRSNLGPKGRFRNVLYRMFFPPSDERAFLSMTGDGLHDVAMGDQGSVPNGTRAGDIVAWRARPSHSRRTDRALPRVPMPIFRHCLGGFGRSVWLLPQSIVVNFLNKCNFGCILIVK